MVVLLGLSFTLRKFVLSFISRHLKLYYSVAKLGLNFWEVWTSVVNYLVIQYYNKLLNYSKFIE